MKFGKNIRILPLLILTALLSFSVRLGDFFFNLDAAGSAHAQGEVIAEPPPMNVSTTGAMTGSPTAHDPAIESAKTEEQEHAEATTEIEGNLDLDAPGDELKVKSEDVGETVVRDGKPVEWKDATDTEIENSIVREELYTDLAKRREQLEKREKEIAVREALLSAAEREVDQKIRELNNIKAEIEAMMTKMSDEEESRIASLVKIYEGMKPKDAASIFNTLDLDILVEIMGRMSERKSAPILSEMSQDRARTVTIMMVQRSKSPLLPDSN